MLMWQTIYLYRKQHTLYYRTLWSRSKTKHKSWNYNVSSKKTYKSSIIWKPENHSQDVGVITSEREINYKPSVVLYTFNVSAQEVKSGGLVAQDHFPARRWVKDQSGLHGALDAIKMKSKFYVLKASSKKIFAVYIW